MNNFKKALYILSWIPVAAIKIVLALLGLVVVPIALQFDLDSRLWPKVFWLWGNDEHSVAPRWWMHDGKHHNWFSRKFPNWWWFAIRNPVNNTRFIFEDREVNIDTNWHVRIKTDEPYKIVFKPMEPKYLLEAGQQFAYRWSWNGPFAGYRKVWLNEFVPSTDTFPTARVDSYSEIWFGWKVGSDVPGMGFTMQLRLKREIGQ